MRSVAGQWPAGGGSVVVAVVRHSGDRWLWSVRLDGRRICSGDAATAAGAALRARRCGLSVAEVSRREWLAISAA